MRQAGIAARGAYHFGHPGEDATSQAKHFVRTVGGSIGAGEFLVLDIETASLAAAAAAANGTNTAATEGRPVVTGNVAVWAATFVKAVMQEAHITNPSRVWVYTGVRI
jgi:hypothetical protein